MDGLFSMVQYLFGATNPPPEDAASAPQELPGIGPIQLPLVLGTTSETERDISVKSRVSQ